MKIARFATAVGVAASVVLAVPGPASAGQSAPPVPTEAQIRQDLDDAVSVVDEYWREHFSDFFEGTYRAPKVLGIVDENTRTGCGAAMRDNAFYCPADRTINFGVDFVMLEAEIGDMHPYILVAHEWAHAIQSQIAKTDVWQAKELQADCMAGAVLADLVQDGDLVLEKGDDKEIKNFYIALDGPKWKKHGDHGSPEQRIAMFDLGWNGGMDACF